MVLKKSWRSMELRNRAGILSLREQDVNQPRYICYISGTESADTEHQKKLLEKR